jgi:hypothetical protein
MLDYLRIITSFGLILLFILVPDIGRTTISFTETPALYNFMRLVSTVGPGGWVLSQVLLLIHDYLDNGSNNCGLNFHFENPRSDNEIKGKCDWFCNIFRKCCNKTVRPDSSNENEDTVDNDNLNTHDDIKIALLRGLFMDKVNFKSETGR